MSAANEPKKSVCPRHAGTKQLCGTISRMPSCYLCGADATTRDHVPARAFFSTLPPNIIAVPACAACNGAASTDEEYMRTATAGLAYAHNAAARTLWEDAVRRSFARRPAGLRRRLAGDVMPVQVINSEGHVIGELPGLQVDGARADRVMRKIFKGIYFFERGTRLAEEDLIIFRGADIPPNIITTEGWHEQDMGEVFRYRSVHEADASALWIEFYRTDWWFALTGDSARNYGRR